MRKIRAFLVALLMVATSLFVVGRDASPVSAVSNCATAGQYYSGGTYAGISCYSYYPIGGSITITITCKYYKFWAYHTYNVSRTANWTFYDPANTNPDYPATMAGTTGLALVSCGNHNPADRHDWIIHIQLVTSPVASYWGYPYVF